MVVLGGAVGQTAGLLSGVGAVGAAADGLGLDSPNALALHRACVARQVVGAGYTQGEP